MLPPSLTPRKYLSTSSIYRRWKNLTFWRYRQKVITRRIIYPILLIAVLVITLMTSSLELYTTLPITTKTPNKPSKNAVMSERQPMTLHTSEHTLDFQQQIQASIIAAAATTSSSSKCIDFEPFGNRSPEAIHTSSIFNCGSTTGRCVWYYPAKFFHPTCGYGKEYIHYLSYMEEQRKAKNLWSGGMPPIVLPWASLSPELKPTFRTHPFPRHNISMIHVHKTGGTSMVLAFDDLKRLGAPMERHVSYLQSFMEPKATQAYEKTSTLLNGVVKYQDIWNQTQHTLIAVIRDPAERFISAIGQAMGAQGSNTKIASEFRQTCLKSHSAKETLACCIDKLEQDSYWFEVHFTPMVLEISFASLFKDIPIAIFPFSTVPDIMYELDQNPSIKRKDGTIPGFRKDPILTSMSMKDYDSDLLQRLCNLYRMDTLFLHYLGYTSTCDVYTKF